MSRLLSSRVLFVSCAALLAAGLLAVGVIAAGELGGFVPDPDDPSIAYLTAPTTDRVAALNREIRAGRMHLKFAGRQGYLRSALDALHIPIESQMVVYSKTGVQAAQTSPRNPRVLFFDDSVVVGWVRGGFVEVAAQDPRQGVVFYTLPQAREANPQFTRHNDCLTCHDSSNALDVPGLLVRSQVTAVTGRAMPWLGSYLSDHRRPLEQRWGGWYVTGQTSAIRHMGNALPPDPDDPGVPSPAQAFNLASLQGRFDTEVYPSPYSDIVALLVFEHQMHMMNLITRLGWQTRYAEAGAGRDLGPGDIEESTRALVDYMLFVDEAPFGGKIAGSSGFAEKFSALGPRDPRGRSLRQLDLQARLLRYPCSYLIYSPVFDALPPEAKDAVYKRMWQILSGAIGGPRYARLSAADRRAVVEILRDTKPGLPAYFQAATK